MLLWGCPWALNEEDRAGGARGQRVPRAGGRRWPRARVGGAGGLARGGRRAARGRPASRRRSRPFPSGPRRSARPVPHDAASATNFFLPIPPPDGNGRWPPRRRVSCPSSGGGGGAMTRWVPTKREEKYGVGEQPAGGARGAGRAGAGARGRGRKGRPEGACAPPCPARARPVAGRCALGPWAAPSPRERGRAGPRTRGAGGGCCVTSRGSPPTAGARAGAPRDRAFQPRGRPQLGVPLRPQGAGPVRSPRPCSPRLRASG